MQSDYRLYCKHCGIERTFHITVLFCESCAGLWILRGKDLNQYKENKAKLLQTLRESKHPLFTPWTESLSLLQLQNRFPEEFRAMAIKENPVD